MFNLALSTPRRGDPPDREAARAVVAENRPKVERGERFALEANHRVLD